MIMALINKTFSFHFDQKYFLWKCFEVLLWKSNLATFRKIIGNLFFPWFKIHRLVVNVNFSFENYCCLSNFIKKNRCDLERAIFWIAIQVNNNALMKDWRDYNINATTWEGRKNMAKTEYAIAIHVILHVSH